MNNYTEDEDDLCYIVAYESKYACVSDALITGIDSDLSVGICDEATLVRSKKKGGTT